MVTLGELWVSKSQYLALSQLRSPSCDFWHSNKSSSAAPVNFKGQIVRRHTAKIQNIHQRMHKYASSILKPFKAAELASFWYRVYLVRGRIAPPALLFSATPWTFMSIAQGCGYLHRMPNFNTPDQS